MRNLFVFSVLVFIMACSGRNEMEKKPNILILFSDQHNKKVMGYEGHSDAITPNLNRLASESFVFDRAYCTTGICAPSRSSLMTGIYPRTLGILSNNERTNVMKEVQSMSTMLKNVGYKTYAFGKRHTALGVDAGWDINKSHLCGESPDDNYVTWIESQGYGEEFFLDWSAEFGKGSPCSEYSKKSQKTADLGTRLSALPEGYTMEAYTAKNTIEVINAHQNSDQPFLIWANFYRPHQPYTPLEKYMSMYDVSEWGEGTFAESGIKKPETFHEPIENLPPFLQAQRRGGNKVWNMDKAFGDEQLWRNYIGAYYALISEVDYHVGQIVKELENTGLKKETIIIYTSDHGDFVGSHGMVEKAAMGHNVYEDILQIPLIIHYPGQDEGQVRYDLVSQVDILPTILDIIGVEKPELTHPIQGISLHAAMKENSGLNRDFIVSESWSQATIITQDNKLGIMLDPTDRMKQFDYRSFGDMFFDRKDDPSEIDNLINDSRYESMIDELRKNYQQFEQQVPDTGKRQAIAQHRGD